MAISGHPTRNYCSVWSKCSLLAPSLNHPVQMCKDKAPWGGQNQLQRHFQQAAVRPLRIRKAQWEEAHDTKGTTSQRYETAPLQLCSWLQDWWQLSPIAVVTVPAACAQEQHKPRNPRHSYNHRQNSSLLPLKPGGVLRNCCHMFPPWLRA